MSSRHPIRGSHASHGLRDDDHGNNAILTLASTHRNDVQRKKRVGDDERQGEDGVHHRERKGMRREPAWLPSSNAFDSAETSVIFRVGTWTTLREIRRATTEVHFKRELCYPMGDSLTFSSFFAYNRRPIREARF